jgi:predicted flap endonuclease-1-like 5' DNA nuclease
MITRETTRKGAVLVTFTLLTEEPVSVVGDFNEWDPHVHPLGVGTDGKRAATVELFAGRYAFRYLADGGRFFDDPEADYLESNGMGDSHGVIEIDLVAMAEQEAVGAGSGVDGTATNGATVAAPASAAPATPLSAAGDPLERIEGIGPKIADALRAGGLATFAALAGASDDRLRDALAVAGLRFAPSLGTWAEQAGFLARGDEDGFAALTERLTAGRPAKAPKAKPAKAAKGDTDKAKPKPKKS